MKGTCTDHNHNTGRGRVSTDWVGMLGILDFLEFDDRLM